MSADQERITVEGLQVDAELHAFVERDVLPGLALSDQDVWRGLSRLVSATGPRIAAALETRSRLQAEIDAWHLSHRDAPHDPVAYHAFLEQIGYLVPAGEDFTIATGAVDPEIATIAGPQLVVPITNARYALNAANARWGSLYDAVYGTDTLGDTPEPGPYSSERGARVVTWARALLDDIFPLTTGSHADARGYQVLDGAGRLHR